MDYGELLRQIRTSKGMKLKEAASDTLSTSQLSRFENGRSMIPVDSFLETLKNINTTPQEFLFLFGDDDHKEMQKIFENIESFMAEHQYDKVRELRDILRKQNPAPYSWKRFVFLFIESLLVLTDGEEPQNQPEVLTYLMQVADWGEMELRIYALFGFVFDVETTYLLMKTAVKKSQKYMALPQDAKLLFSILSNNFSTFVFHKRYDYAQATLAIFEEQLTERVELLEPHLDFLFNQGILAFCQGREADGIRDCERVVELCQLFRQHWREKRYNWRYQNWRHGYKDPEFRELAINIGVIE
ncbi:Rgg family transcriptional regulator [Jeotgalibaca sp. A122]|uniref:Rgg family transcriptional regulator n=1 Tax=Jeotgalibaca sp. A122 TaxID=3457322 RepID=UPI003FD4DB42